MHEQMKRLYEAARVLKHIYGQSGLARLFNVSPQTIHNWQARGISKQGMLKAQEMVGCSAFWLETGSGHMALEHSSVRPEGVPKTNSVPLVTVRQAARYNHPSWNSSVFQETKAWLFTQIPISEKSFAMEISTSAMMPKFEKGDWIIIDPAIKPEPGDFVLAKYGLKNKIILRKYQNRGRDASNKRLFELVPLNDDHPSISSNTDSVEIIGIVIEQRKFRK